MEFEGLDWTVYSINFFILCLPLCYFIAFCILKIVWNMYDKAGSHEYIYSCEF